MFLNTTATWSILFNKIIYHIHYSRTSAAGEQRCAMSGRGWCRRCWLATRTTCMRCRACGKIKGSCRSTRSSIACRQSFLYLTLLPHTSRLMCRHSMGKMGRFCCMSLRWFRSGPSCRLRYHLLHQNQSIVEVCSPQIFLTQNFLVFLHIIFSSISVKSYSKAWKKSTWWFGAQTTILPNYTIIAVGSFKYSHDPKSVLIHILINSSFLDLKSALLCEFIGTHCVKIWASDAWLVNFFEFVLILITGKDV